MIGSLRITEQNDLPALARFLVRVYKFEPSDFHADPRLLEWKYLYPRAGWEGGRSYLLERDGRILAHAGICPVSFRLLSGEIVTGLTIMDWAGDPSSPGAGIVLFRRLREMTTISFVIGGAAVTRQIVPRIGFRLAGDALTYAAWLRPWREFRARPRTGRSILRLLHGLTHPVAGLRHASQPWEFIQVNEFDDSLDPILKGTKRGWTFCHRAVADLNYLLKCPHVEMRGFLLKRQGLLCGYFIIGKSGWEARVLDIFVNSADLDDWEYAYAAATNAAALDPEVCRVRILSTVPILSHGIVRRGYWCQYKEPVMLHDPTGALDGAFPVGFQLFDGDSGY